MLSKFWRNKKIKKTIPLLAFLPIVVSGTFLISSCNNSIVSEISNEIQKVSTYAADEGIVLLKNEDFALPLDKQKTKISAFSVNNYDFNLTNFFSYDVNLVNTLKRSGFKINPILDNIYLSRDRKKYTSKWQHKYGWNGQKRLSEVNEMPLFEILKNQDVEKSFEEYNTALFTISRGAGENFDLKPEYLELSKEEKELLEFLNKKFNNIIVIINSSNQMPLGWINKYKNIKAVLNVGIPGLGGDESIAKILSGEVNPSGRLSSTYSYDFLSAPNNINYTQTFDNVVPKIENNLDWPNEEIKKFYSYLKQNAFKKYVVYQEGIYVGYKYYETRYYDKVKQRARVGDFDYNSLVQYPIGYGLSYTNFEYSNFNISKEDTDNNPQTLDISVDVKNVGQYEGKDSVVLYLSKPYTSYDIQNEIEKSAIEIIDFNKTKLLKPNEIETLEYHIDKSVFKVYDQNKAKTYIDESGSYYFSIGKDSHDALNNMIKREDNNANVIGNKNFSIKYDHIISNSNADGVDDITYSTTAQGKKITNLFAEADFKNFFPNFKYLSRNDWIGTFPTLATTKYEANEKLINSLKNEGLEFDYLVDKKIIDQSQKQEQGNNENQELEKKVKFWTDISGERYKYDMNLEYTFSYADGGQGIENIYDYNKRVGPSLNIIAQSMNKEIQENFGKTNAKISNDFGITFWCGIMLNTHRNYLNGRNYEYVSEDNVLVAKTATNINNGFNSTSNGNIGVLKHLSLNETEENRFGIQTYINEQAFREQYLSINEYIMNNSTVKGIMGALNRVGTTWSSANINLINKYLKAEQSYNGIIMTDAWETGHAYMQQKILTIIENEMVDILVMQYDNSLFKNVYNEIKNNDILTQHFNVIYDQLLGKYYDIPSSKKNFWKKYM